MFDFIIGQAEYIPTVDEFNLLKERISTRIIESKQIPRYYGKEFDKYKMINLLSYIN